MHNRCAHRPTLSPVYCRCFSSLPLQFSTIFLMVFGGEVLADWIKHGFIIKFNQLTPSIYDEYSTILARCGGIRPGFQVGLLVLWTLGVCTLSVCDGHMADAWLSLGGSVVALCLGCATAVDCSLCSLCAKCLVWRELSTLTYLSPSRLVRDLRCACVVTCGGKARLRKLQKAESVISNPFPFLPSSPPVSMISEMWRRSEKTTDLPSTTRTLWQDGLLSRRCRLTA